jgi:hypothetical protein
LPADRFFQARAWLITKIRVTTVKKKRFAFFFQKILRRFFDINLRGSGCAAYGCLLLDEAEIGYKFMTISSNN